MWLHVRAGVTETHGNTNRKRKTVTKADSGPSIYLTVAALHEAAWAVFFYKTFRSTVNQKHY